MKKIILTSAVFAILTVIGISPASAKESQSMNPNTIELRLGQNSADVMSGMLEGRPALVPSSIAAQLDEQPDYAREAWVAGMSGLGALIGSVAGSAWGPPGVAGGAIVGSSIFAGGSALLYDLFAKRKPNPAIPPVKKK